MSDELKVRIASALVLGVLVLALTWIGGRTFELLCILISFLIFHEFTVVSRAAIPTLQRYTAAGFLALVLSTGYLSGLTLALGLLGVALLTLAVWEYIANRTVWTPLALGYAALPYFAMSEMRGNSVEGLLLIFVLFGCVWGADVFAYFAGKSIGGPKLAPRISPKKTWSGFLGGMTGSLFVAWGIVLVSGKNAGAAFVLLVLLCAMVSQIGDLAESVLKRRFDFKDSGNMIPGHGGILDRIDGLIPAAVVLWVTLVSAKTAANSLADPGSVFVNAFLLP